MLSRLEEQVKILFVSKWTVDPLLTPPWLVNKKKKTRDKNLIWVFVIRVIAAILVSVWGRKMNGKLGGLEKSKLTGFLMSQIICKSNSRSKSEVLWSQRKNCILMNYYSIFLSWKLPHLLLLSQSNLMSFWKVTQPNRFQSLIIICNSMVVLTVGLGVLLYKRNTARLAVTGNLIFLNWV